MRSEVTVQTPGHASRLNQIWKNIFWVTSFQQISDKNSENKYNRHEMFLKKKSGRRSPSTVDPKFTTFSKSGVRSYVVMVK